ncbi:MAG TPA: sensor domain-containing diguanylate cyclase [Myxococcales bacterium]|jgi:diguanylate cyclase (GGDEF)-like protein/PAS domain S-box-containing protein
MDPAELFSRALNFDSLAEAVHDGLYCLDDQGRIAYWNRAAEEITGYSRAEVLGSRCSDNLLVHVDAAGRSMCQGHCPMRQSLADGQRREAIAWLKHKAGHRLPVHVRVAPLRDAAGKIVGAAELFSDDSARQALVARAADVERMAMLDSLTGLPNRRYLEMTLELRVDELRRYGWPFGVLLVDVDHFKQVNDRHGHEAGDRVLKAVADTMGHSSRLFDVVGRWGGEEFLVVLSHLPREQLVSVGERLRTLVATCSVPAQGASIQVTISLGAAMGEPGESATQVLARADRLLYQAKESGRNRVAG